MLPSALVALTICTVDSEMILASVARVGSHSVDLIQPDDGRRRVDGVHHVVERAGHGVDVLAVERRDECRVQTLDDLVGQRVALVLDSP